MKLSPFKTFLIAIGLVGTFAFSAEAEPDVPAPQTKTAAIAHVTVSSLSQLSAAADDLAIPLPAFLTAAGIEQEFPFVGAGGMRSDLPVSIDYLMGGNIQSKQMAMFYFPLAAGHAPIADFLTRGQPMGTDGALVNGVAFRRTGSYLIWGGVPDVITAIPPEKLPDARADNPLVDIVYDGKLLREVAPKVLEDYRQSQLQQDANSGDSKSQQAGYRAAVDWMTRDLDRVLTRVEKKESLYRITTAIEPAPTFTLHDYQMPGLPEGCAFRLDWQPPHDWARRTVDFLVGAVGKEELFKDAPDHPEAFADVMVRIMNTVLDGDEATYGMELLDSGPVFYSVTHSNAPRDVQAEFTDIQKRSDELGPKIKNTVQVSNYVLPSGTSVSRMAFTDSPPIWYIDSVEQAGMRMTTIGGTDTRVIGRLLDAKPVGPSSDPASGWVDGKQTLSLMASLGKTTPLSDENKEVLNKVLQDQRINWTVNTKDSRLNVIVDVPAQLIRNVMQNIDALQKAMSTTGAAK